MLPTPAVSLPGFSRLVDEVNLAGCTPKYFAEDGDGAAGLGAYGGDSRCAAGEKELVVLAAAEGQFQRPVGEGSPYGRVDG